MLSGNTSAQQAQFDAFFAEDDNVVPVLGLSGIIGSSQTAQLTSAASQPNNSGAVGVPLWRRCCFMLAIETYQPYFDVDTVDVQQRIVFSLKFFNETNGFWNKVLPRTNVHQTVPNDLPYPGQPQQHPQLAQVGNMPDVYAPFWMATTLILLVSVCYCFLPFSAKSWYFFLKNRILRLNFVVVLNFGVDNIQLAKLLEASNWLP
jgi:hypothetical protein